MEASGTLTNTMFATQILPPCGDSLSRLLLMQNDRCAKFKFKIEIYVGAAFIRFASEYKRTEYLDISMISMQSAP